jgi:hypothetical protein
VIRAHTELGIVLIERRSLSAKSFSGDTGDWTSTGVDRCTVNDRESGGGTVHLRRIEARMFSATMSEFMYTRVKSAMKRE